MRIPTENENLIVERMELGPLGTNCYVLTNTKDNLTAVVDPGGSFAVLKNYLQKIDANVVYILNTHGHWDHIGANAELKEFSGARLYIHQDDAQMLGKGEDRIFGVKIQVSEADDYLEDGQIIELGDIPIKVYHTPGHTKGGVCFELPEVVITGDTLFQYSIGRTDLEGGDFDAIINSIKTKLYPLADKLIVLPGHGPESTIGTEKKSNPYTRE